MAMYVKNKQIFIFVADSDAIDDNRIKESTNSSSQTTNYCPPESKEQNDKFYKVLGSLDALTNKHVYLDVNKIKEYKKIMISRIKNKYAGIYKGSMVNFESNCDKLISLGGDSIISNNLYLTGERPYLNFSNSENWKLFKSILFGESSIIVVEDFDDKFKIFPMFRPLFLKPEELIWDEKNQKVKCDNNNVQCENKEKYLNFKKLLKWFVNQLNINNGLVEGAVHSGKGCNDAAIRGFYSEWRDYEEFTLDCNIQCGYQSTSKGANYINVTKTGINIRPEFDSEAKNVINLYIDLYGFSDIVKNKFSDLLGLKYPVEELSLSDENEANEKIKELFDNYYLIIKELFLTKKENFKGAFNKIYYGAPGCGKSYYVKHELLPQLKIKDDEEHVTRTTFYQDYSNTDFAGQILPKIDNGDVTYKFTPGPFAIALKNALSHQDEPVALIIEEINRGNAASIFGDIFQLLDRKDDGQSEYEINHVNLQKYIEDELGISLAKIYVPSNLYIIATMNTSDQNVFTLDTAFKRRWNFEKIKNDFSKCNYSKSIVPGTNNITWENLVTSINNYIVANADELTNEDKQIGAFFVDEKILAKNQDESKDEKKVKDFAYKVLEYLWDDVAKFGNKSRWFSPNIKTLDQLIDGYIKNAETSEALKVFGNDLNELIKKND